MTRPSLASGDGNGQSPTGPPHEPRGGSAPHPSHRAAALPRFAHGDSDRLAEKCTDSTGAASLSSAVRSPRQEPSLHETIREMSAAPPDDPLRTALGRLGDQGERADRFLQSAAKHLNDAGADPVASHHAAYALREALMSIVELGGVRPLGMRDAADEVVRRFEAAGADTDALVESIRKLGEVLRGPGPNVVRVERALSALAGLPPTRASADLITRFIDALDMANTWTHGETPRPIPEVGRSWSRRTTRPRRSLPRAE